MKFRVLVVDDDTLVNEFLVETLQRAGYECRACYSGEEGVREFQQAPYDIVLLD